MAYIQPGRVLVRRRRALLPMGDISSTIVDDVAPAPDPGAMTQDEWQRQMLAKMDEMVQWQGRWVKKDELQRWIQIAATVSIPLFTGLWKWLGFKRAGGV